MVMQPPAQSQHPLDGAAAARRCQKFDFSGGFPYIAALL